MFLLTENTTALCPTGGFATARGGSYARRGDEART